MKKWKLGAIITTFILIVTIVYFILLPSPLQNIITSVSEKSENKTSTPFRTPFISLEQTPTTQSSEISGGGTEEGKTSGGGGNETEVVIPKQTLSIDSFPSGLRIYVNYSFDGNSTGTTIEAPYSLEIDKDSTACVLPVYITGSGVLKWTLDDDDCEFSICKDSRGEDSSYGCKILMDNDHVVMLHYTPLT